MSSRCCSGLEERLAVQPALDRISGVQGGSHGIPPAMSLYMVKAFLFDQPFELMDTGFLFLDQPFQRLDLTLLCTGY